MPHPPGRYLVTHLADILELEDTEAHLNVSVYTPAGNAFEIQVNGHDVLRKTFATVDEFKSRLGLDGIPLLWPYANRLDEQAFYANGNRYPLDMEAGNIRTLPQAPDVPIHGYLLDARQWKLVEASADATGAWVTVQLDFYRIPAFMKQFPFAHTITLTYRVANGVLEVRTTLDNLSDEPMPVQLGFHPYFQLTDSCRDEWTIAVGARTHWTLAETKLPTGATQPMAALMSSPHSASLADLNLDDVVSDLERDPDGRASVSLMGRRQRIDVSVDEHYKAWVLYSPPAAAPERGFFAIEPMTAITNALNMAHRGDYNELQHVAPRASWTASFWIRGSGF